MCACVYLRGAQEKMVAMLLGAGGPMDALHAPAAGGVHEGLDGAVGVVGDADELIGAADEDEEVEVAEEEDADLCGGSGMGDEVGGGAAAGDAEADCLICLLYTSPSPRDS